MKQATITEPSLTESAFNGNGQIPSPLCSSEDVDLKSTGLTAPQKTGSENKNHRKKASRTTNTQADSDTIVPPAKKATRVKGHTHEFRMDSEEQKAAILKDLRGERTVYESDKPHKVRERARKAGEEVWLSLPERILNRAGKSIVSDDPNLSFETMQKLLEAQPPEGHYPFYFVDDNGGPGIGITSISICIDDNPDQSMAELIARYAELRHVPFTDTALACLALYKKNGNMFVHYTYVGGIYRQEAWSPAPITSMKPPKKKSKQKNT